jgi:hypothetical protein
LSLAAVQGLDVVHVPEWFRNTETDSTGPKRHNPSAPQDRPQAPQLLGSAAGSMHELPQQMP